MKRNWNAVCWRTLLSVTTETASPQLLPFLFPVDHQMHHLHQAHHHLLPFTWSATAPHFSWPASWSAPPARERTFPKQKWAITALEGGCRFEARRRWPSSTAARWPSGRWSHCSSSRRWFSSSGRNWPTWAVASRTALETTSFSCKILFCTRTKSIEKTYD